MDFLNKAFTQFNDLFRSMTPGGRITAGLLLIVAVVSVGYLFQSQTTGGDVYLFSGQSIPTPTLQKMEEAFGIAGLNGFSIEGGQVKVPHAQRAAYLAALADHKSLPPSIGEETEKGDEVNMIESPAQHRERLNHAKEREISLVLSLMKGIERASVLIDSQAQPGLGQATLKTASVFAAGIGSVPLDEDQVDKIIYYVAAANAGMKPEDVTVTDSNGTVHVKSKDRQGGFEGEYAREVRRNEEALNGKIRNALAHIPGTTVVSTFVLDRDKGSRTVEHKIDPKTIPVRTDESSRSTNRESGSPGGAPGLGSQGGGVNQPANIGSASKSGNETSEEQKNEQVNVVSSTSTEKGLYDLTPKSAKVSIGIPASYYEKVWKERNPTKEGEEPKKPDQTAVEAIRQEVTRDVQAIAANLLPPSPDVKDPAASVTVTTFQDIKPAEIAGPGVPQKAFSWLGQNWPMVAMIGLVLVSVRMLRSVLRSVPAPAADSAAMSARISANESQTQVKDEPVEAAVARRLRRMSGTGPSLRDELSELVKEDPDSAANILRSWIGQVN